MDNEKQSKFIIKGEQSKIKKMNEEANIIIRSGKEYVKIGGESDGKMVRRDIWENRFKKNTSPLGEIEAYGRDSFGIGSGHFGMDCDPYDFRIKTPINEMGKMVKKLDAFLKDEVSKSLGLFIGVFSDI